VKLATDTSQQGSAGLTDTTTKREDRQRENDEDRAQGNDRTDVNVRASVCGFHRPMVTRSRSCT
jgi:hypothetical protein